MQHDRRPTLSARTATGIAAGRIGPALALLALAACTPPSSAGNTVAAAQFPTAARPTAGIGATRYSTEAARDRLAEAGTVMALARVEPGMTVADIGAGDGYYTVRLASRVGSKGRVLAQDIQPGAIDALGQRVAREHLDNVSIKHGAADDPGLPAASFDRIFMVHMYHEIAQPYAFLWNMRPALRAGGEVIVVDTDAAPKSHGLPPALLQCEFAAVGYRLTHYEANAAVGGYYASFVPSGVRPAPDKIEPCKAG